MSTSPAAHTPSSPFTGSLLDDVVPPAPVVSAGTSVPVAPRAPSKLRFLWTDRRWRYGLLGALLLSGGVTAFFLLRPVPQPDYAADPMDDVLNYTLLTDEFNKLPVDKRLELLAELIQRVKTMSADDSSLMAAFAASIDTDKLRKQLEENASRLALDVWDKFALDYQTKPADSRDAYLDQVALEMTRLMETVGGVHDNKSDEDRLAEMRKQAKRDQEAIAAGKGPTGGQLARMADLMRNRVGSNSSPQQQQRGVQLMRDMTRHFRGQDPVTGKPASP